MPALKKGEALRWLTCEFSVDYNTIGNYQKRDFVARNECLLDYAYDEVFDDNAF